MFKAVTDNITFFLSGFTITLELAILGIVGGVILGSILGLGRISKNKFVYHFVSLYINILRNIPLILVIFWFYFFMPIITGHSLTPFFSATIAFIIFESSYFAEIFRSGYQSIRKDLVSAALSTGMTHTQIARYILIPIAFKRMLPSLVTQAIVTFQDTSLAFVIGLREFVKSASIVNNIEVRSIQIYGFVAIVFFIFCFGGSKIAAYFEMVNKKTRLS